MAQKFSMVFLAATAMVLVGCDASTASGLNESHGLWQSRYRLAC